LIDAGQRPCGAHLRGSDHRPKPPSESAVSTYNTVMMMFQPS
jgi:hypothetical protein